MLLPKTLTGGLYTWIWQIIEYIIERELEGANKVVSWNLLANYEFPSKAKVPQVLPEKISPLFVGHKINLITCKINFTFLKTHGCPSAIPSPARVSEDGTRVSPACEWLWMGMGMWKGALDRYLSDC